TAAWAKSWGCAIASTWSRGCNSTPSPSSANRAMNCWPILSSSRAACAAEDQENIMDITTALARVVTNIEPSTEELQDVMRQIMTGQCTDAQIGGFLVALRMKSESLDEITVAALAMRELASGVTIEGDNLVGTCG